MSVAFCLFEEEEEEDPPLEVLFDELRFEPPDELDELLLEPELRFEPLDELLLEPELRFEPLDELEPLLELELLFPDFVFDSAILGHLRLFRVGGWKRGRAFRGPRPCNSKAVEEVPFHSLALLGPDQAVLMVELKLQELALDVVLVVQAPICLLGELIGYPCGSSHGGERQQCKFFEESHQASSDSSTKLCGGRGPVSLKLMRGWFSSAIRSSSSSNA
jgi:hypothetical protein